MFKSRYAAELLFAVVDYARAGTAARLKRELTETQLSWFNSGREKKSGLPGDGDGWSTLVTITAIGRASRGFTPVIGAGVSMMPSNALKVVRLVLNRQSVRAQAGTSFDTKFGLQRRRIHCWIS